jgi:hypothetical protein
MKDVLSSISTLAGAPPKKNSMKSGGTSHAAGKGKKNAAGGRGAKSRTPLQDVVDKRKSKDTTKNKEQHQSKKKR